MYMSLINSNNAKNVPICKGLLWQLFKTSPFLHYMKDCIDLCLLNFIVHNIVKINPSIFSIS